MSTRPKVFINIATNEIGGPGKGLLQFLRCGGQKVCEPVIVGFNVKEKTQFDLAMEKTGAPFEMLRQSVTYDPLLIYHAISVIKKHKPDIIQSHGYKSHLICFFLKYITGKSWIAFFHGWVSGGFKVHVYNMLEKYLICFADKIVPVSNSMVEKIDSFYLNKNKIYTIYNAVDPDEYAQELSSTNIRDQYNINKTADLVAVVGRFSFEKGHRYFVEALPQIIQELPDFKVVFIGDGPLKDDIQQRVDKSGLDSHVIFTGYQSNIQDFYREIDLLVLPSLSEGMPNVALEAMLFGKPVVATRVGGVPEVVVDGETGIIVDPRDPKQLATAVIRLFNNREMLCAFGTAGRERVLSEFGPVQRVKRIAALYEEVFRSKHKDRQPRIEKNGYSNAE